MSYNGTSMSDTLAACRNIAAGRPRNFGISTSDYNSYSPCGSYGTSGSYASPQKFTNFTSTNSFSYNTDNFLP